MNLNNLNLITVMLWAIFFGIIYSIIYISLQKKALSRFVLGLIASDSTSVENAKTLSELGIVSVIQKRIICSGVKSQHGLIRTIGFASGEKIKKPGEFTKLIPGKDCRYFIDSNISQDITKKYTVKKSNKLYVALCIVALFLLTCVASTVISWLFSYADSVFNGYNTYIPPEQTNQQETIDDENVSTNKDTDKDSSTQEDNKKNNNEEYEQSVSPDTNTDKTQSENAEDEQNVIIQGPKIPIGPLG